MRLKSGVLLAGLLSFVAHSSAKLRWKCELFDTSQETSTRTTFVEYVKNRPPHPNPRPVRSTSPSKCRPRPKNGTVGPSTESEKMRIESKRELVQEDVPNNVAPEDTDAPHIKYQRKETRQSTDLNIGPGFEESNDPYGRSKQPVPRLFRPAELKGADQLDRPLTEHLDENVMPDFEFDDDDSPSVQEDLPWCPEEPEDCETADLKTMSTTELIEFKQKCESMATPGRLELIEKLIATDDRHPMSPGVEPTTDRTAALPPTGSVNCSESPSSHSRSKLEKYRKECPCEDDTSEMDEEELEQFKRECLEPIEIPGDTKKMIRKNGRCAASQKTIDRMGEKEYEQFVKECLVGPKNITLRDILVVEKSPECTRKTLKSIGRDEFSDYRKRCLKPQKCDEIDEAHVAFKKICSARKTTDLCETENLDELDDEKFAEYKRKCIFDRSKSCDSVDVDSLNEKEAEKFEEECSDVPMGCENVRDPGQLSKRQMKRYQRDCLPETPDSPPPVNVPFSCSRVNVEGMSRRQYSNYKRKCDVDAPNCQKAAMELDELTEQEFRVFLLECTDENNCEKLESGSKSAPRKLEFTKMCAERRKYCNETIVEELKGDELEQYREECERMDCESVNPKELGETEKLRYRKECGVEEEGFDCDNVNEKDLGTEEFKKYQKQCLRSALDCSSVNPKTLSKKEFRRFEKKCIENIPGCRDVTLDEMGDAEYEKYMRDCLKDSDLDCDSINPDELDGKKLEKYREQCSEPKKTGVDCSANPKKLSKKQLKKYEKNCLKKTPECKTVDVEELNDEEYEKFAKKCIREESPTAPGEFLEEEPKNPDELGDCKDVDVEKLTRDEYETYKKGCRTDSSPDCEDVDVQKMSDEEFQLYKKKCAKDSRRRDCSDVNVEDLSADEYTAYRKRCGKPGRPVSPDEESPDSDEYKDCHSVDSKKLSRKQFKKYEKKCLERKSSAECEDVDSDSLSEEELEKYKRDCLQKKSAFDCTNVNPDELSDKQRKLYETECLATSECDSVEPRELSRKQLRRYEKLCIEREHSVECDRNPDDLSDEEFEKYKMDCLKKKRLDCEKVNPKELSEKQKKRFERECGKKRADCETVRPEELNREEYAKYKRDCLADESSSDCEHRVPEEMTRKEFEKYERECLSDKKRSPECESVSLDELSEEEFIRHKKTCSSPGDNIRIQKTVVVKQSPDVGVSPDCDDPDAADYTARCSGGKPFKLIKKVVVVKGGNDTSTTPERPDECEGVDVERMSDHEYNVYKKNCNVRFEREDCDDVRVAELKGQKLQKYLETCGLFCGIELNESIGEKERKAFEERCEKGAEELEKDCKDIVLGELGERLLGEFADKCVEHIDACSMLKSRRLVRKVYNEYRLKCNSRLRPSKKIDCNQTETEALSLEQYNEFRAKCGGKRRDTCDDVDVDGLTEQEFEKFKKRCRIDTSDESCKEVHVESLSRSEYRRNLEECGRVPSEASDDECEDVRVDELSQKKFIAFVRRCGNPSDTSIPNCDNVDLKSLSALEFEKYKRRCLSSKTPSKERSEPPGGSSPPKSRPFDGCSDDVDVDNLSVDDYKEYRRKCLKGKSPDCDDVDADSLDAEAFRQYKKRCGSPGKRPDYPDRADCHNARIEEMSADEYVEYKRKCLGKPKDREETADCSTVNVENLSEEEYKEYKRKCSKRKTSKPDCDDVDVESLSDEEFIIFRNKCSTSAPGDSVSIEKKTSRPDCDDVDVKVLSDSEYREYQKRCGGNPRKPTVVIKKTVVVKENPRDGSPSEPYRFGDCSNVDVARLSEEDYAEYKKKCRKTRKSSSPDCEDVDVDSLSDEEYLRFERKCPEASGKCSDVRVEELSAEEYAVYKRRCLKSPTAPGEFLEEEPKNPDELGDCKDVDVEKLTRDEHETYKKGCQTDSSPDCEDVDVQKMSDEEFQLYKKRCAKDSRRRDCSDVEVEDLSADEYTAYRKRCGKPGRPEKPRGSRDDESPESGDCSDVNVEELSAEEYVSYKRRCLKDRKEDENCLRVNASELTEKEYRAFRRRCPESATVLKKIVMRAECRNKSTESMTKQEYQKYLTDCSLDSRKPHVELTKVVKIVEGPSRPGGESPETEEVDECLNRDVNTMGESEYREFRSKCGEFRKTFQFNCNSDVSKMSESEFRRFRKTCGKKAPFNCKTADVDALSDDEYERFVKECGREQRPSFGSCRTAKVERMSAEEFEAYREKCLKQKTSRKSHDECEDVKVEELSKKEYALYKEKCVKKPETLIMQPPKERKKIDCSIMETSQMSREEYADFKKHCNVRVQTDRFRPGENIILTKKVEIHTGKEPFSCYDRDVDAMSDEEYAEFEKRCLQNPHFRYDCSNVDTSSLERDEYVEYQKQCQQEPKTVVLAKKLVVEKKNAAVKGGCYDRNVDEMSDGEYAEYERDCLGISRKPERKAAIDCHNVDLSKLSYDEIEEHLKMCRTRETASTPAPRRRQSLKCSDVSTDSLDEAAYAKWVRECLEIRPKTIELEKKLIINSTSPLMSGGETVTVEKVEIRRQTRPDDDEGYLEGKEDFGVRLRSGTRKHIRRGVDDDDQESESGVILVKKVIHKVPRRRRPIDSEDEDDEGGVIEVKKLIMKTSLAEPEGEDSEDVEEIVRRPRKKVGPKEEVVLLSVTKRHGHPYRTKSVPEDEEPVEIVKLTKNTVHPDKVLREVRIRKHFGQGLPEQDEAVVQEIGGPDFRIVRKTVMVPRRVRKMKSTTTTTTTPAEPEYYYDEEEVPEIVTLVKVDQSARPLRKHVSPVDEDEEYVDVKEDEPKSFVEFEGFVKVHGAPRKIRRRPKYTDSGEEPEIREVTRKVVMQPGGEDDDLKGVRLRSHRKMLRRKTARPEEIPEDSEHEVTVVKKLKVLRFGNEEKEMFDEDENPEDDGRVIVRNKKRKYVPNEKKRPEDEEEDEETVEGRVAVRGRAPKRFRLADRPERKNAVVSEANSQFYRIGESEEDDVKRRKRRRKDEERPKVLEESEESGRRKRRRPGYEEESEEIGRRRRAGEEEEEEELRKKPRRTPSGEQDYLTKKIKKFYRIGPDEQREPIPSSDEDQGESVTVTKRKTLKMREKEQIPESDEEAREGVKLMKRKKFYRIGPDGKRELIRSEGGDEPAGEKKAFVTGMEVPVSHDQPGEDQSEEVSLRKKKVYRIGPDGRRELVREDYISEGEYTDEEIRLKKKNESDGKRDLVRPEEDGKHLLGAKKSTYSPEPLDEDQDEEIKMRKKKRFYRIGPDGKRELFRTEGDGEDREEAVVMRKKALLGEKASSYSPTPLSQKAPDDGSEGEEVLMQKRMKKIYRIGPNGRRELVREEEVPGGETEEVHLKKKKRFYRIGPDGKRELIRTEEGNGEPLLGETKSSHSPVPLENGHDEEIKIMKKRRFYRIGPDGKRELVREEGGKEEPNSFYGKGVLMHEQKKAYQVGQDGERKLVRSEDGENQLREKEDGPERSDGEVTHLKKRKRFYRIGPDGKRELIRTEGDDDDKDRRESSSLSPSSDELMGLRKYGVPRDIRKSTKEDVKLWEKAFEKRKNEEREDQEGDGVNLKLSRKTHVKANGEKNVQKVIEAEEEGREVKSEERPAGQFKTLMEDGQSKPPPGKRTKKEISQRGFITGGAREPSDFHGEDSDAMVKGASEEVEGGGKMGQDSKKGKSKGEWEEEERTPRKKRTYVVDKDGNRKLVTEQTDDEESDLDLGTLLRPKKKKKKGTETERVKREHTESRFEKRGAKRVTRSSKKKTKRKMQKYRKDGHVRASGKSEEEVPNERIGD